MSTGSNVVNAFTEWGNLETIVVGNADPKACHAPNEPAMMNFEVTDKEFELLYIACRDHTDGQTQADITIQTCWDSDRLDLYRAGIKPKPDRLCTEFAKKDTTRAWANRRADEDAIADVVAEIWEERFGRG